MVRALSQVTGICPGQTVFRVARWCPLQPPSLPLSCAMDVPSPTRVSGVGEHDAVFGPAGTGCRGVGIGDPVARARGTIAT